MSISWLKNGILQISGNSTYFATSGSQSDDFDFSGIDLWGHFNGCLIEKVSTQLEAAKICTLVQATKPSRISNRNFNFFSEPFFTSSP
jgi:hypothetical protein